ncbi:MAG: hypothetical protein ABFD64_07230 [Armatimonadota bacterium]
MDTIILLLILATVGMLAVVIWSAIKNRMQPVRQVRAIVLRHRTRDDSIDAPLNPMYIVMNTLGRGPGRSRMSNKSVGRLSGEVTLLNVVNGFITFGVEGNEVELLVPGSVFTNLQDNQTGLLVHQGEKFLHFSPDSAESAQPKHYEQPKGRPLNG